jgi:hypothetical protein
MGCGCGGAKTRKYEVTKGDGTTETVDSLSAAAGLARSTGGSYRIIRN